MTFRLFCYSYVVYMAGLAIGSSKGSSWIEAAFSFTVFLVICWNASRITAWLIGDKS